MNVYDLLRNWYNFKFDNPSKTKSIHSDLLCYLIDKWNRLGQKKEFGLPTTMTMELLNIGSYNTYKKTLDDLVEFGFVKIVKESKNQYQSKIIALSKIDNATDKALDKATIKASDKASDTIDRQINKLTNSQVNPTKVEPINFEILLDYINEKTNRSFRIINKKVQAKYNARLKEGYTKKDIQTAIDNAVKTEYHKENGFKYLTPEFFSRADKIDLFSQTTEKEYISPEDRLVMNVNAEIERVKNLKK